MGGLILYVQSNQSEIIKSYFGLQGKSPLSLEDIASEFDLTREPGEEVPPKLEVQLN